jgi:hypothetical protein
MRLPLVFALNFSKIKVENSGKMRRVVGINGRIAWRTVSNLRAFGTDGVPLFEDPSQCSGFNL